jgi:hypothetical protein
MGQLGRLQEKAASAASGMGGSGRHAYCFAGPARAPLHTPLALEAHPARQVPASGWAVAAAAAAAVAVGWRWCWLRDGRAR